MQRILARVIILAAMAGAACGAVGGGGGMNSGMGGGGGGGMAGTMNGPVEGVGGVVGPGAMGNWGGGGNNANNPLIGQRYTIVFIADEGGKKSLSALSFGSRDLSCDFLNKNWSIDKLGYEGHAKTFTASLGDNAGNSLKLTGTICGAKISGTLTLHQAKGDRTIGYAFHGGVAGGADADAAKVEFDPAQAKAK